MLKAKGFDTYREVYRLVTLAHNSVAIDQEGVPGAGARQLRRYATDEEQGDEVIRSDQ